MDLALLAQVIHGFLAPSRFSDRDRRELRDYVMRELDRQGHDTKALYFHTLSQLADYCAVQLPPRRRLVA